MTLRIRTFTSGPQDWQSLLDDPVKHWRKGYSARTFAYSWEAVNWFYVEYAWRHVVDLAKNEKNMPENSL